jgi:outer membrane protein
MTEIRRELLPPQIVLIMAALCLLPLSVMAEDQGQTVTLEQCLQAALSTGPDLRRQQADLSVAEAQHAEAVARNSFALTASTGAGRNNVMVDNGLATSDTVDKNSSDTLQAQLGLQGPTTTVDLSAGYKLLESDPLNHSTSVSLSADQTLWDGYTHGRGYAELQQAELTLRGKRIAGQDDRRALSSEVTKAYYALLSAQRSEGVQKQTLSQRQEEMERVQTLFDTHNSTAVDLLQARINLKSTEIDLREAEEGIVSAREKLSQLLGWPLDKLYTVAEVTDLPLPAIDAEEAVARALQQRAELKQLRLTRLSGDIDLAVKRAQSSPTVSAGGSLGWSHDWTDDTDYGTWSANLSVSVPVFDAGLAAAQIRQATMKNESSRIQEEQLVTSISAEVRAAVSSLHTLEAKEAVARQSLELAEARHELAQLQLESGSGSAKDLLDASVTLGAARVALSEAQSEMQLGILNLRDVMGE